MAIGANEEEPPDPIVSQNDTKEAECGGVGPLEIVEEEDDDVLAGAQRAQQLANGAVEPVCRLGRSKLGDHWLWSDNQLEIREHIEDHPSVRCEGPIEFAAPLGQS
jgi:hypothetical protein